MEEGDLCGSQGSWGCVVRPCLQTNSNKKSQAKQALGPLAWSLLSSWGWAECQHRRKFRAVRRKCSRSELALLSSVPRLYFIGPVPPPPSFPAFLVQVPSKMRSAGPSAPSVGQQESRPRDSASEMVTVSAHFPDLNKYCTTPALVGSTPPEVSHQDFMEAPESQISLVSTHSF